MTDWVHQGREYKKLDLISLVRLASSENGFGCGLGLVHPDISAYHDTATLFSFEMNLYTKGDLDYKEVKKEGEEEAAPFLSEYDNLGSFYQSLSSIQQSEFFDADATITPVCYGGIFSASIANIYKRDMKVWKSLTKKLERGDNIQEGHYAERLWATLLSTPLKPYQIKALKNYATGVKENTLSTHGPLVRTLQEGDVTYMDLDEYWDEEDCADAGTSCDGLSCCSDSTSCLFVSEFGDSICIHENVTSAN